MPVYICAKHFLVRYSLCRAGKKKNWCFGKKVLFRWGGCCLCTDAVFSSGGLSCKGETAKSMRGGISSRFDVQNMQQSDESRYVLCRVLVVGMMSCFISKL